MDSSSNFTSATATLLDEPQRTPLSSLRTRRVNPLSIVNNGGLGHPSAISAIPSHDQDIDTDQDIYDKPFLPGQPRSLSGIATRSLLLGIVLTLSTNVTLYTLLYTSSPLWRASFFIAMLSLFHYLEFWTTARYNTSQAKISSFLLSQNGSAYNIAHTAALLECLLTNSLFPSRAWTPPALRTAVLSVGLAAIALGQTTRSVAMIAAGTNFNHIVQHTKARSHRLVTTGVYGYLRHPSYFGFFWWGLGTQLVLGNPVCFVAYALVLWRFFSRRISGEEELLVRFFGDEYVQYRKRTRVGIPFVR